MDKIRELEEEISYLSKSVLTSSQFITKTVETLKGQVTEGKFEEAHGSIWAIKGTNRENIDKLNRICQLEREKRLIIEEGLN